MASPAGTGSVRVLDQPVAHDRDEELARVRDDDAGAGGVAGGVGLAVEGELEEVGRLGAGGRGAPAGVEADAGRDVAAVGGGERQLVAAPVDRQVEPRGRAGEVERAVGDAAAPGDGLVVPDAVLLVPLEVGVDPRQRPARPP